MLGNPGAKPFGREKFANGSDIAIPELLNVTDICGEDA